MDYEIWDKIRRTGLRLYLIPLVLICLWVIWAIKSNQWGSFLITMNSKKHLVTEHLWIGLIKCLFYLIHILINFLLFLSISMQLRYSLVMLGVTILVLLIKVIPMMLTGGTTNMSMQLPLYVDVVLIFSIAGYMTIKKV